MTIEKPRAGWLSRSLPLVHEDLSSTYERNLHRWLIVAPIVGITAGLGITAVATVLLRYVWPRVLALYLAHHWIIIPGLTLGGIVTGLLMQFGTPDPNLHSTEEVIEMYHENNGKIDLRSTPVKLIAAITTVGSGGSAALEGPAIYGGAAIGTWVWSRLSKISRLGLTPRHRRILLLCGAAAGMSAVFRAPLTGIVFALEMPYKDDMAHEALVPSLIASVVSYMTLGVFFGSEPLFAFTASSSYVPKDLVWCALLGMLIGLIAMTFVITFRRLRRFVVECPVAHWIKMGIGGLATALCGLAFLHFYPGTLVPLGPNYEAVRMIIGQNHSTPELLFFTLMKLAATACTLGVGGVSAMFVPLFLSGGSLGAAFGQSVVHTQTLGLYEAVGMTSFISAAYKAPLAAVVFMAETTGGHGFLIPALVGAAIAYVISGDASISPAQHVHSRAERQSHATA
ncbi:chloride channel protein [Terriglobus sp. TAA 43]|uniref:chloride channel protein n=1 Tax=Terriglobus sp. TAA 43 TaxID=278961 RepID=UPI00068FEFB7|nr:chloride channel protein [Terriglobus sp. TAA 43]